MLFGLAAVVFLGPAVLGKKVLSQANVYENPGFLPRTFVVHRVQVASDGRDAFEKVMDDRVNLKEVGIVEIGDGPVNGLQTLVDHSENRQPGPCSDGAEITRYEPQRVHLRVDLCKPGLVQASIEKGWKNWTCTY